MASSTVSLPTWHPQAAKHLEKIAFIGNYLPRKCGIATFTTDLCESVAEEFPDIECFAVAINDIPDGYNYPPRVRFEIAQGRVSEYRNAADFLNMNHVDMVCVQHEFGIFGGPAGGYLLAILRELRMPIVTTLHTVLREPSPQEKRVFEEVAGLSDQLVVMSEKARGFLREVYNVPEEKTVFIHHGIPDVPFIDPNYYKDIFGVEGRKVILTFGLLSPGKGVETMIRALPAIVEKHPDVVYIVLGATHPNIVRERGEEYRLSLERLTRELGVEEFVAFHNRFVELEELCQFLGSADLYVTPYLNEAQIVSGTLAYSLGAGKAVVSTPYWYAQEMLADGRGRLVPFEDSGALAEAVIDLLSDEVERHAIRKRAYTFCRQMTWKEVSRRYMETFAQVREERGRSPRRVREAKPAPRGRLEVPTLDLRHLRRLTDDTGILQHANYTVPNRAHGYCTDDNARALVVAMRGSHVMQEAQPELDELAAIYLSFLGHAFHPETGKFRNFMSYDRRWLEEEGSQDSHGRALWGLGAAAAFSKNRGLVAAATHLFLDALAPVTQFKSPRSLAFTIIGIHEYLRRFSGDAEARRMREELALRLYEQFAKNADDEWPWLEDSLTYSNARLPQALLMAGQWTQRGEMVEMGLRALQFLLDVQRAPEGHFSPIGHDGWYPRGGAKARFDQQPIEAGTMVSACIEAWHVTQDARWIDEARMCFEWFLGRNDLGVPLYDYASGGCHDGLHPDRRNQNQGAESTLAWLLAAVAMEECTADQSMGETQAQMVPSGEGPEDVLR